MSVLEVVAAGWRIAFLTAFAPVIGSVLLLALARLTGAGWQQLAPAASAAWALIPAGILLGLAQLAVRSPHHLAVWMAWWAVGLRAVLSGALLGFAAGRLKDGASVTFAGVTLALVTAFVTPVAADWMLGQDPGHPVSAIGMMLVVEGVIGATALLLASGEGRTRLRRDMGRLMVAGLLGLAYLAYMDFLIVWFGNLPTHVDFYVARSAGAMVPLVWGALIIGVALPIAALWLGRDRGARLAGMAALLGLLLFNGWWTGGGLVALLVALLLTLLLGTGLLNVMRREAAHG